MDSKTQAATWLLTHCKECVKIKKQEKQNENEQKIRIDKG